MKNVPTIKFSLISLEELSTTLAWTSTDKNSPLSLSDATYYIYPELKDGLKDIKESEEGITVISKLIANRYNKYIIDNKDISYHYQEVWNKYNDSFMNTLSSYMDIKWNENTKNIICKIGALPTCPRDIRHNCFQIYNMSDVDLVATCMHECCHFLFFEKCMKIIPNWQYEDFDSPSLLWYLSEILIDPILNSKEIQKVFKYDFKSYEIFYNINIKKIPLMDTIKDIFNNNDFDTSIIKGLSYLKENEEEFRKLV